ncbi:EGg Laying defective family member (egl-19) [Reticulomyxa filosa]|uniref:EGg Laying defective family member (Egl-19) n=1 Tax=Reticulomyxa filosa TaxID=46433 RepID=X6MV92_RETFI|nr:EGg Laying defective family member (egl-19) [Reticulomyxa filosa]|eukprot:ETO17774.1 EGg Laying defective family member (egl-19) [Reticulomyxa filosa]
MFNYFGSEANEENERYVYETEGTLFSNMTANVVTLLPQSPQTLVRRKQLLQKEKEDQSKSYGGDVHEKGMIELQDIPERTHMQEEMPIEDLKRHMSQKTRRHSRTRRVSLENGKANADTLQRHNSLKEMPTNRMEPLQAKVLTVTEALANFQMALSQGGTGEHDSRLVAIAAKLSNDVVTLDKSELEKMSPFRQRCYQLIRSIYFECFVVLLAVVNTITLSISQTHLSKHGYETIVYVDLAFLIVQLVELVFKMFVLGFKGFWTSRYEVIDALVIIVVTSKWIISTSIDGDFSWASRDGLGLAAIVCLRSLHLIGLLRRIPYFENFNRIMSTVSDIFNRMVWFMILVLFLILTLGLVGTSWFGSSMVSVDDKVKLDFSNAVSAVLTVFQLSTGQDWMTIELCACVCVCVCVCLA